MRSGPDSGAGRRPGPGRTGPAVRPQQHSRGRDAPPRPAARCHAADAGSGSTSFPGRRLGGRASVAEAMRRRPTANHGRRSVAPTPRRWRPAYCFAPMDPTLCTRFDDPSGSMPIFGLKVPLSAVPGPAPPVRARRRSRPQSRPPLGRSGPGEGAAEPVGALRRGDGDAGPVGARRRSRHRSGPGNGAATSRGPSRAGRASDLQDAWSVGVIEVRGDGGKWGK